MKKYLVIIASILMLINSVSAKDSSETNPNSISSSPDLEMYGQNIKGVNRVETDRVVLSGSPRSSSDAVSKGYVDSQISAIESMVRALKNSVEGQNKVINRIVGQQQILNQSINNMNNSVSNQINSLQIRVSRLENTPPPSPPPSKCPTTAWYSKSYALNKLKQSSYRQCDPRDPFSSRHHGASCVWLAVRLDLLNCKYYEIKSHRHDSK